MHFSVGISQERKKGADTCDSGFPISPGNNVELVLFVGSQMIYDLGTSHLKIIDIDCLQGTG